MVKQRKLSNYIAAVLITVLASLMIVLTSAIKILLTEDVNTLEVLIYMNVVTAFFFFLYIKIKRTPMIYHNKKLIVLRGLMGFVGVYMFFFAYELGLSLSAGIVISRLVPVFSVLGMILFMKERIKGLQKIVLPLTLAIAFVGVIIIADPFNAGISGGLIPTAFGVAAGMTSGFALVVIRKLMETDKPELVSLFNSIFIVTVGMIILVVSGQFKILSLESYLLLILIGFFNTFAVFGLALSTVFASPTKTAPFSYFSVIFAPIVQFILFGSIIATNVAIGAIIIVGVNFVNLYINIKYRNLKEKKESEES
jgi:drug/metabolite transporter (DMT)-like permease